MTEQLVEVINELKAATSFDELEAIDSLVNEATPDLAAMDEYRAAFDDAEASLNGPATEEVVTEDLPDDVEQLKAMVRNLQATSYGFVRDHVAAKRKTERVRAGVSFRVHRRDVHFTQPQAEVIAQAIIATGKQEISEADLFVLLYKLREARVLGGTQTPIKIFRYYMAEGTMGYKARGFLSKVG